MQPVFVLAPPRSSASLVCAMIGQHPDLVDLPEVNLFMCDSMSDLARLHQRRPRLRQGLLRAVAELGLGAQDKPDIEAAEGWLGDREGDSTASVYADLADWALPRRTVDKSPAYVASDGALDRINAAFPQARYIHLLRHPWSAAREAIGTRQKLQEHHGAESTEIPLSAEVDLGEAWLEPHLRVREFLEILFPDQWVRLRAEDLLDEPDLYLGQIAEWLGVATDAEAIAAMKRPERSPFARPGPSNARLGNAPEFIAAPALPSRSPSEESLDDLPPEGAHAAAMDDLQHYARLWGYR